MESSLACRSQAVHLCGLVVTRSSMGPNNWKKERCCSFDKLLLQTKTCRKKRERKWQRASGQSKLTAFVCIRLCKGKGAFHASPYICPQPFAMATTHETLRDIFNRIPRRHTADNVKEIYGLLDEYEDVLKEMEADEKYATHVAPLFDGIDEIRATVKKSNDPKASKKGKDVLFDEASGAFKDAVEGALKL